MDGFALTEAIRAHPTLANIPVLILSSRSSAADRQRGLDVRRGRIHPQERIRRGEPADGSEPPARGAGMSRATQHRSALFVVEDDSAQRTDSCGSCSSDGDIIVVGQAEQRRGRPRTDRADPARCRHPRPASARRRQPAHDRAAHGATLRRPILVLSARIDDRHSPSAVEALVAGALDALPRPVRWTPELGAELRRTVRQISKVHVIRHPRGNRPATTRPDPGPASWKASRSSPSPPPPEAPARWRHSWPA